MILYLRQIYLTNGALWTDVTLQENIIIKISYRIVLIISNKVLTLVELEDYSQAIDLVEPYLDENPSKQRSTMCY